MGTASAENKVQREWDAIWSSPFQRLIGLGRSVYNRFFARFIQQYSGKSRAFLEIGCGSGSLLRLMGGQFASHVGLDLSPVALGQATGMNPFAIKRPDYVLADCFKMPFHDGSFDVVWSQGLHEHFDNYQQILREELRVCAPGGVVLAGVPYKYSYPYLWYLFSRLPGLRKLWPWADQVFFSLDTLREAGRMFSPRSSACLLRPWFLGIAVLVIPKDRSGGSGGSGDEVQAG